MDANLPKVRMRPIPIPQSLVEKVVEVIVSEIVSGELPSNGRLIQDDLARAFGVSRQPIQQALLLLRNQGLVRDAPGRGLIVAPLDVEFVEHLYEIRAALDGLSASMAAKNGAKRAKAEGPILINRGRETVKDGSLADQIAADMAFHTLINDLSGNPLIGETSAPHWPYLRRVMAEVLREEASMPKTIWDEHAAILDAIVKSDAQRADDLSKDHIHRAAKTFVARLKARQEEADHDDEKRRSRRIIR